MADQVAAAGVGAELITPEELQLALRNHGTPLEALRYPLTPVGLHYLLTHYDIPPADPAAWRLQVAGRVRNTLDLSLDDLRAMPSSTLTSTMECAGNGRARLVPRPVSQPWLGEAVGTAEWRGTALRHILDAAGPLRGAVEVLFTGADRGVEGGVEQAYARSLSIDDATREDVLVAYEMNGADLPPQHGYPLRLLVPGWYGMTNVKWLRAIDVLDEPYAGYQNLRSYRVRLDDDDPGTPVTRMQPRALMIPPGIPDFMTRQRFVPPGRCVIEGRAWSGWGAVERVDVSDDGGGTWRPATLGDQAGPHSWRAWSFDWAATEGVHELCCRATDATGRSQPDAPVWNVGGYANNAVQRVVVTVPPAADTLQR